MGDRGLGTGLGALFGEAALSDDSIDCVLLPISKVEAGRNQPRKYFDEIALEELSQSIREHGIIQPITVRKLSSGYYQIIAGERRWRAARKAGLSEVPARVIEADDKKVMEIALIENLQREDLNPVEEAEGIQALLSEYGFTQEETANRIGKSRPSVANALRLLTLPAEVKDFLEQGALSAGHARAVLQLKTAADQISAAQKIVSDQLSVRQAESLVRKLSKEQIQTEKPERDGDVNYLEVVAKQLTDKLGRRVNIVDGRKKGRFEIEFYGNEDLEQVIDALQKLELGKGAVDYA